MSEDLAAVPGTIVSIFYLSIFFCFFVYVVCLVFMYF